MMLTARTLKWFISLSLLLISGQLTAQKSEENEQATLRQWRVGVDVFQPAINWGNKDKSVFEGFVDYYWKKELYAVLEGGFGKSNYAYPDLRYSSANPFLRIGFDKSLLPRLFPADWDVILIGLRYGIGYIQRSEVDYTVGNSIWGYQPGTLPAKNQVAHWGEIVGGMRLNLIGKLGAGWNVRGKFLLNGNQFKALPPNLIAGYGKGDNGTVFGFNVFITYTLMRK